MTVKELWDHFVVPPYSFALKEGDIMEITHNKNRTRELLRQYADRRVKDWCVGYAPPSYFLHIFVESEDAPRKEKTDDYI